MAKTGPGAECGSDHEHHIAKFRLKLKKVGKTSRPFRYDLNQIPYDYIVEEMNKVKGLDLVKEIIAQSCTTLCSPMDCSLPGSNIHAIFQARILKWVAISFSRGSS